MWYVRLPPPSPPFWLCTGWLVCHDLTCLLCWHWENGGLVQFVWQKRIFYVRRQGVGGVLYFFYTFLYGDFGGGRGVGWGNIHPSPICVHPSWCLAYHLLVPGPFYYRFVYSFKFKTKKKNTNSLAREPFLWYPQTLRQLVICVFWLFWLGSGLITSSALRLAI